jgi:hypothetical protein
MIADINVMRNDIWNKIDVDNPSQKIACCSASQNKSILCEDQFLLNLHPIQPPFLLDYFLKHLFGEPHFCLWRCSWYVPALVLDLDYEVYTLWLRYYFVTVSGTGAYDNVRPLAYQDAKVFLLCFRVSDPDSLDNAVSKVCDLCVVSMPCELCVVIGWMSCELLLDMMCNLWVTCFWKQCGLWVHTVECCVGWVMSFQMMCSLWVVWCNGVYAVSVLCCSKICAV